MQTTRCRGPLGKRAGNHLGELRCWDRFPEGAPRPTPLAAQTEERESKKAAGNATSRGVKKVQANQEKTTLGDLDALADLKSQLENSEKSSKKTKK